MGATRKTTIDDVCELAAGDWCPACEETNLYNELQWEWHTEDGTEAEILYCDLCGWGCWA